LPLRAHQRGHGGEFFTSCRTADASMVSQSCMERVDHCQAAQLTHWYKPSIGIKVDTEYLTLGHRNRSTKPFASIGSAGGERVKFDSISRASRCFILISSPTNRLCVSQDPELKNISGRTTPFWGFSILVVLRVFSCDLSNLTAFVFTTFGASSPLFFSLGKNRFTYTSENLPSNQLVLSSFAAALHRNPASFSPQTLNEVT
jgi:hypothetical protein